MLFCNIFYWLSATAALPSQITPVVDFVAAKAVTYGREYDDDDGIRVCVLTLPPSNVVFLGTSVCVYFAYLTLTHVAKHNKFFLYIFFFTTNYTQK